MKTIILAFFAATTGIAHAITLAEARTLPLGTPVTVDNLVITSTTDLINSANSKSFTVRDLNGDGLPWANQASATVFGGNAAIDALLLDATSGDTISISGITGTFNGLFQIVGNALNPLTRTNLTDSNFNVSPTLTLPSMFQDAMVEAEVLESNLVKLVNVSFADAGGTFAGAATYVATDGSQSVSVRVSTGQLNLVGTTIPSGKVDLIGVLSQFDSSDPRDGGYQLLLRSLSDVSSAPVNRITGRYLVPELDHALRYNPSIQVTPSSGSVLSSEWSPFLGVFAADPGNLPLGYSVSVKAGTYLSKNFAGPFNTLDVNVGSWTTKSGDVNGDDEVGAADFSALAAAYDAVAGDPNFLSAADLNGDQEVGAADFSILAANYDEVGG